MPDMVDIIVGRNLRSRRKALGMTQQQLGEAIGVSFQQLQKYETAANRIAASRLWRAACVLAWPVEQFFNAPATPAIRATDGRPDDPYNGQRPVQELELEHAD